MPHDVPQHPFQKVGADLFELNGVHYLLVVDYYSKFPIVRRLGRDLTATSVIAHLRSIASEYGVPETLISDNGPQFANYKFKEFCAEYGIDHNTSSPRFPQSNGMAERTVQTVKNLLKRSLTSNQDPSVALLNFRSTPISASLPSPAELLHGRRLRTGASTTIIGWMEPDDVPGR